MAASVEHSSGRQRLLEGEGARLENHAGVPFLWLRTPTYQGNRGGRMRNMLHYAMQALMPANTRLLFKPDAVIGSSVHPFAAAAGALLAKRFGVPFIFEVRDLWPQTLIDFGRIKNNGMLARMMRALELWLYRRAARIVTLLPRAVDYIVPLGISEDKVVWIPNGADISSFPDPGPRVPDDKFTLMYFGAHGQANALEIVLHAMKQIQADKDMQQVCLRMIGDGPAKESLQKLANELELKNVKFEPPIPKSSIPLVAAEADAFILSVLNKPNLYRYGISMNKIYDYFAARRPIVMLSCAVNDPVGDAGAGLTIPSGNLDALVDAIKQMASMRQFELDAMGASGRKYIERNGDYKALAEKLAIVLDECVAQQGRNP